MDNLKNKKLVFYGLIGVGCLFVANNSNIRLNIFFAILLAGVGIYLFNTNVKFKEDKEKEIAEEKKKYIVPNVEFEDDKIVDFVFSIQDYHKFNPVAYETFCDCLVDFFKIIKNINKNNKEVYNNWTLLEKYKNCALNNLHSITLSLPSDINVVTKLDKKILVLEEILIDEMLKVYNIYKDHIKKNRNWHSKEIVIGPKPYNSNESNLHSFDYYL